MVQKPFNDIFLWGGTMGGFKLTNHESSNQ